MCGNAASLPANMIWKPSLEMVVESFGPKDLRVALRIDQEKCELARIALAMDLKLLDGLVLGDKMSTNSSILKNHRSLKIGDGRKKKYLK